MSAKKIDKGQTVGIHWTWRKAWSFPIEQERLSEIRLSLEGVAFDNRASHSAHVFLLLLITALFTQPLSECLACKKEKWVLLEEERWNQ